METSFEKVWKRVKASEPFDDAEKLQGFIRDELRDAADYIWLARKTGALPLRRVFMSLAEEERKHAKKLQAAAFMNFGLTAIPSDQKKKDEERMLGALRRRYTMEQSSAEAYLTGAEKTSKETLKKLYLELSEEEHKHAEMLCLLLENMM